MEDKPKLPKRKKIRLEGYDYSSEGCYFTTICTESLKNLLSIVGDADLGVPKEITLKPYGKIAEKYILSMESAYECITVNNYIIMPNHVHMIVILENGNYNLSQIIAQYKSGVTRWIRKCMPDVAVWQRSYHDHVIRNQAAYEKIWLYIEANPKNWDQDCFYLDPNIG